MAAAAFGVVDAAPADPVEVDDPEDEELVSKLPDAAEVDDPEGEETEAFKLPDAVPDPEEAPDPDAEGEADADDVIVLPGALVEDGSADETESDAEPKAELTTDVWDEIAAEVVFPVIMALD